MDEHSSHDGLSSFQRIVNVSQIDSPLQVSNSLPVRSSHVDIVVSDLPPPVDDPEINENIAKELGL